MMVDRFAFILRSLQSLLLILCPWTLFQGRLHPPASSGEDRTFQGQLTLYLEAEKGGTPLSFTLQGIEARREKGEWVVLPDCRGRFSAQELGIRARLSCNSLKI